MNNQNQTCLLHNFWLLQDHLCHQLNNLFIFVYLCLATYSTIRTKTIHTLSSKTSLDPFSSRRLFSMSAPVGQACTHSTAYATRRTISSSKSNITFELFPLKAIPITSLDWTSLHALTQRLHLCKPANLHAWRVRYISF